MFVEAFIALSDFALREHQEALSGELKGSIKVSIRLFLSRPSLLKRLQQNIQSLPRPHMLAFHKVVHPL